MSVVIFIVILAGLILSHEFGHFIVAKKLGIRVDEFGLGFPPKILSWKRGETTYSLNLIPFGGFVKIFGEDPEDEALTGPDRARSLIHKPKSIQAAVLVAGVFFNFLLAWLLVSIGFVAGLPMPVEEGQPVTASASAPKLLVTSVLENSPAARADLKTGDELVTISDGRVTLSQLTPSTVRQFTAARPGQPLIVTYHRGRIFGAEATPTKTLTVTPVVGLVNNQPQAAIGVGLDQIALRRLNPLAALGQGLILTAELTYQTARGFGHFIRQAFDGGAQLGDITGPVGLAGLASEASQLGFIYLLSFTAFISINLAVINLIPFPALDGGRLFFLLIEKIKGSMIKPAVTRMLNLVGFVLLILLMLVVTYHDIAKLFS